VDPDHGRDPGAPRRGNVSQTSDPDLSPAGESRARQLGPFLADALPAGSVDHLYAADTRRAQQTAASVANQFKLPINLLGSSDWAGIASRIKRDHRGATVVVVGYSASFAGSRQPARGSSITLEEGDFGSIFVVVLPSLGQPQTLRLRYGDALRRRPEARPDPVCSLRSAAQLPDNAICRSRPT